MAEMFPESTKPAPTGRLFNNPVLSDVTVKLVNNGKVVREYRAHKAILAAHSGFFFKAFTSNSEEVDSAVCVLYDVDPEILDIVIKYLYLPVYDLSLLEGVKTLEERILVPLDIEALAAKYDIQVLDRFNADAFLDMMENLFDTYHGNIWHVMRTAVKRHYTLCKTPGSLMGKSLAKAALKYMEKRDRMEMILMKPTFGADVALCADLSGESVLTDDY